MKKMKKIIKLFVLMLVVLIIATGSTCKNNVALGPAIDITPPELKILSPPIKATVRNSFTLKGTVHDDTVVKSVSVSLQHKEVNRAIGPLSAKVDRDNNYWELVLNRKKDGAYPLIDGTYKITVLAEDESGKTITSETAIVIDNTPPLLVLNRPSTIGSDTTADTFGDALWVNGQSADESGVSALTVYGYDKTTKNRVSLKTEKNVPPNVQIKVDAFSDGKEEGFYKKLYGTDQYAGKKEFYCDIELWDNAREYDSPDSDGKPNIGNRTSVYYLYSPLYNGIVFPEYTVDSIYKMMSGIYQLDPGTGLVDKNKKAEADKILEGLKTGKFENTPDFKVSYQGEESLSDEKIAGLFALNPIINPKFEIIGFEPIDVNSTNGKTECERYEQSQNSRISVRLNSNLDNIPLKPQNEFKFYALSYDKYKALDPNFDINTEEPAGGINITEDIVEWKNQGATSYIATISIKKDKFTVGEAYVLLVAGMDKENNPIIPTSKSTRGPSVPAKYEYGFKVVGAGRPPEIKLVKVNDQGDGTSNIIKQVFVKKGDSAKLTIDLQTDALPVTFDYKLGTKDLSQETINAVGNFTTTIQSSEFVQTKSDIYTLIIKATASNGQVREQNYQIYYDIDAPEIKIINPIDGGQFDELTKNLEISGTANDGAGSGLDKDSLTVELKKDGTPVACSFKTKDRSFSLNTIDLSTSGEGNYTLTIKAKDKLGLEASETVNFIYDAKFPFIKNLTVDSKSDEIVYTKSSTVNVSCAVVETNELDSLKVNGDDITFTGTGSDADPYTFTTNITLSPGDGEKDLLVKAQDKAGKTSTKLVKVFVDTVPPKFEDMKIASNAVASSGQSITTTSGVVSIDGKANEVSGSGIKLIEASLDGSTWKPLSALNDATGYCTISGTVEIALNDTKTVKIRATDKAGNEATWTCKVSVSSNITDITLEAPAPTASGSAAYTGLGDINYRKGQFELKLGAYLATADGTSGTTMSIKNPDNSDVALADFFETPADVTGIKILNTKSPVMVKSKSGLADGQYIVTFSAGGQSKSITIVVDNTAPILDVKTPTDGQQFKDELKFYGSISDGTGAGVKKITSSLNSSTLNLTLSGGSWESDKPNFVEGDNEVVFTFEDNLGNSGSKTIKFKYDAKDPVLSEIRVNGRDDGQVLIGLADSSSGKMKDINLTGKVWDTNKLAKLTAEISKTGSTATKEYPVTIDTTLTTVQEWSLTMTGDDLFSAGLKGDGVYTIKIVAEDVSGRTVFETRKLEIDKENPTCKVDVPENGTTVNKTITIKGQANDNKGLESLVITDSTGTALKGVSKSTGADTTKAEFKGSMAYNWSFDLDTSEYPDNSDLVLKLIATDKVGNECEETHTIKINQDDDRPIVTITSFAKIADAKLVGATKLEGTVSDDDGQIETMVINIGSTNYPVTLRNGNTRWECALPTTDGEYDLKFTITDKIGTSFSTENSDKLTRPKVFGGEDSTYKDEGIKVRLDVTKPEIKNDSIKFNLGASYDATRAKDILPNTVLGNNDNKTISIALQAKDRFGIEKAKLELGSISQDITLSSSTPGSFDTIKFEGITLSEEGALPLKITVTDKSGYQSEWNQTVVVDFKAPTIGLTGPDLGAVYYNKLDLIGSLTDEPGVSGAVVSKINPESVKYKIGDSDWIKDKHMDSTGTKTLSELTKTIASWTINFDNISDYKGLGGVVAPTSGNVHTAPLIVYAEDMAGNSAQQSYTIKFDPTGATPTISVIAPKNGEVIGGAISFAGTSRVQNASGGHYVKEIHMEFSKTSTFDTSTSWMINGKDYGKGHKVQEASSTPGILYWTHVISESDVEKIVGTASTMDLYFRVRATSSSTSTTPVYSDIRKITLDKNVAKFANIKIKENTTATGEDYKPNATWIKGDEFIISGEVTHPSDIAEISAKTLDHGADIQELDTSDTTAWFTHRSDNKGYDFNIKVKTSHYPLKSGYIEFDIIAKDNRTAGAVTVYKKIQLKYDNNIPVAKIGTSLNEDSDNTTFTSGKFTSRITPEASKKELYRVIVNGKAYEIDSITGSDVQLKSATDLTGDFDYIIVEQPTIISGTAFQLEGAAEDSGSGVKTIEATLTVNGKTEKVTMDADNVPRPIDKKRGGLVSFKGSLDTTKVDNGKGKLKIVVKNRAGNETNDEIDIIVKNNPLKIATVHFKTDLSGDGNYKKEDNEILDKVAIIGGLNAEKDYRGEIDVSEVFTYKNNAMSELYVELLDGWKPVGTAGAGTRSFELYKDSVSPTNKIGVSTSGSNNKYTIDLANKLNDIGDGTRKLILRVKDESVGGLWYAELIITVKVLHIDTVKPCGVILPFYYNDEKDNSLDKEVIDEGTLNEKIDKHGHIEITPTDAMKGAKGYNNDCPAVSGKIWLRGIAYDNIKLGKLELKLPGSVTETNSYSISGAWESTKPLKVIKNNFSNTGHYVEWEYLWETGNPELKKDVVLTVTDASNNTNEATGLEPSHKTGERLANDDRALKLALGDKAVKYQFVRFVKGEASYLVQIDSVEIESDGRTVVRWKNDNVPKDIKDYILYNETVNNPKLTLNIVPYITKIVTGLSGADAGVEGAFSRASTGEYVVRLNEGTVTGEPPLSLKGFNLGTGTVKLAYKSGPATTLGTASSFAIKTGSKSGDLELETSGVKSINNLLDITKVYNQEPNGENNPLLTANRKLFVWKMEAIRDKSNALESSKLTSPHFIMRDNSDYYISYGFSFNAFNIHCNVGGNISVDTYETCFNKYHNTQIAYDEQGRTYSVATNTDRIQNSPNKATSFTFFTYKKPSNTWNYDTGNGKKRLELAYNDQTGIYNISRVKYPRLKVVAGTSDSNPAKVALAYFDGNNNERPVRLRLGTVDNSNNNTITGGLAKNLTTNNPGSAVDYIDVAKKNSSTFNGGEFVGLGILNDKQTVVLTWYDEAARHLAFSYGTANFNTGKWTPTRTFYLDEKKAGGWYVDLAVDKNNGVHIAYFSNSDGGLKYTYIPYNSGFNKSDVKTAEVDTYLSPGKGMTIGTREEAGIIVPYITYFHPGFVGTSYSVKIAWFKGDVKTELKPGVVNRKFTGDWVIMTMPTKDVPRDDRVCQGLATSGTYGNKKVLVYLTDQNYEMAILEE